MQENYQLHFFMETSAKTGVNAQEMFVKCAEVLYKDYLQYNKNNPTPKKDDNNNIVVTDTPGKKPKKECCPKK